MRKLILISLIVLGLSLVYRREATEAALGPARISLPPGFKATIFADGIGKSARHIVVRDNGDVYVNMRSYSGGGIVALRDTNNDGKADIQKRFGTIGGTGIDIHDGHLYFSSSQAVFRLPLKTGELVPEGEPQLIAGGFAAQAAHAAKSIAFDESGGLYVNSGAPSNACQEQVRTKGSPGRKPCPELETAGGIWKFSAERGGQMQGTDGKRYATGLRNTVAMAWNVATSSLFAIPHGRDQLSALFPEYYSVEDNAELPAEELHELAQGANVGWPYTYYDHRKASRMIAPEYGGDGKKPYQGDEYQDPVTAFPGHWAPNDLIFYNAQQFPARYHGGAFIAFHGSWNRAPLRQAGYKVVFVPFSDGKTSGDHEVFADGFAGSDNLKSPSEARHRPMGLAVGPKGSLFIVDSVVGRIWKIEYKNQD